MPLPFRDQFTRSTLTAKGEALVKTVCTFCGASTSAPEGDIAAQHWEQDHTCNRTVTEARFMMGQALEMQADAKRMLEVIRERRSRSDSRD